MSREERRQYQRMMKGVDRSPVPPVDPGARARLERNKARREASRSSSSAGALTARFWLIALAIAFVIGLGAFSLAWPSGMPFALYVGVGAAVLGIAAQVALRFFQRRVPGA